MIIGVLGKKGSGKDTVGEIIQYLTTNSNCNVSFEDWYESSYESNFKSNMISVYENMLNCQLLGKKCSFFMHACGSIMLFVACKQL